MAFPKLSARDIHELYTCRAALEAIQAAEAARKATTSHLATLRGIVERNALLVHLAEDAMNTWGTACTTSSVTSLTTPGPTDCVSRLTAT